MSSILRKLTTILQMDVARYSAAMEANEEKTFTKLFSYREIIDRLIDEHQGRIFNTAGDAVLAEFSSPTQAVRFAIECQDTLEKMNECSEDAGHFSFRIGINLGDVMISDGDLLGDEVNVAARIEGLAEPGGICISAKVFEEVKERVNGVVFKSLGTPQLKNINRAIEVFAISKKQEMGHVSTSTLLSRWADMGSAAVKPKVAGSSRSANFGGYPRARQNLSPRDLLEKKPNNKATLNAGRTIFPAKKNRREIQEHTRKSSKLQVSADNTSRIRRNPNVISEEFLALSPFALNCWQRLENGDVSAAEDLLVRSHEIGNSQVVRALVEKLDTLINSTSDPEKLFQIGLICDKSTNRLINRKAVALFKKAAASGSNAALEALGECLIRQGLSISDIGEGIRCLESAASLRSRTAATSLGNLYYGNSIGEKDLVKSFLWFWVAAHLGDVSARPRLREISELMTPSQKRQSAGEADDFYRNLMLKKFYAK